MSQTQPPFHVLWNTAIKNPDLASETKYILTLSLTDMSLVTSGNYQRYYVVNNKVYNHIINKDTLMPADYFSSASILCKSYALADALSTALFNISYEDGIKLINDIDNTEAVWIFKDQTIKYTNGFSSYIN